MGNEVAYQDLFNKEDILSISACASEYKLVSWINKDKLSIFRLSYNPNAIHYLESIGEKVSEYNDNCIYLLEEKIRNDYYSVNWPSVYQNPNAMHIIEKRMKEEPELVSWGFLFNNPNAIHIIEEHIKHLDMPEYYINFYCNPNAMHFIRKRKYIDLSSICLNPNAMDIIKPLVESNSKYISWDYLCRNPNAIELVRQKMQTEPEKLDYSSLSDNPSIFELEKMNKEIYKNLKSISN
jgi:hypothetical protein